jgi:integrase
MVLAMSRPHKHPKTGIYWLRRRVPADLVDTLGRREVTRSLETRDPGEAKTRHAQAVSEIEAQWANLRRGSRDLTEREAHALAVKIYDNWLAAHRDYPSRQVLWRTELYRTLWTAQFLPEREPEPGVPGSMPIHNMFLRAMRGFCQWQAELGLETYGISPTDLNRFTLERAIAAAVQRASLILEREEQGIYEPGQAPLSPVESLNGDGAPETALPRTDRPIPRRQSSKPAETAPSASLSGLLQGWWQESQATGLKPSTYESYRHTVSNFIEFLGHDDAGRVTAEDVVRFKDHRLTTPSRRTGRVPSPKTVKDSDLAALKAVFGWAVTNRKLVTNPASGITIRLSKPQKLRSKGFTDAEAEAILRAALAHRAGKESPKTAAAKRWVPWLCAFTGARVGELAQLRKEDVTQREGHWVIRITPDAGTVKTNEAREVTLHPQLIKLGFPAFIAASSEGHLFLTPALGGDVLGPLQSLKNRLTEFARAMVPDRNVAPNHGWRHRFKTVGLEAGIPSRVLDAIQGQAPRSVADTYGDVTLRTIAAAIIKLPVFNLAGSHPEVDESVELRKPVQPD